MPSAIEDKTTCVNAPWSTQSIVVCIDTISAGGEESYYKCYKSYLVLPSFTEFYPVLPSFSLVG